MKRNGFTLIEILIVISIIIVLAAMLGGVFVTMLTRGKNQSQANQLTKIFGALEQFKNDFGEYPSVDTGSVSVNNWTDANALAFRLCQGATGVSSASSLRGSRNTWGGSYLTEDSIPTDQINSNEINDIWGTPLAYCMSPSAFFANPTATAPLASSAALQTAAGAYTSAAPLATSITGWAGGNGYVAYEKNNKIYSRPLGTCGFMGPVSYALKGNWDDSEVNMPEVWSMGEDKQKFKIQYNSSSTSLRSTLSGTSFNIYFYVNATTFVYYDKDNVGGNINVTKIQ